MTMVHEMLYGSGEPTRLDLRDYIRALAGHVLSSNAARSHVALELDLEAAELPMEVVIPSGLILNELIANSVKHAFSERQAGTIYLGLHRVGPNWELVVRDDGVGLPAGFDMARVTSLGLQLVRTLTEQLAGQLEIRSDRGTLVRILFPRPASPARGAQ
jgi:two-component sensor histidine kinase